MLCIASILLWFASIFATQIWISRETYPGGVGFTMLTVRSSGDAVEVKHTRNQQDVPVWPPGLYYKSGRARGDLIGFDLWFTTRADADGVHHVLAVPHWVAVLLAALLPLKSAVAGRRDRFRRQRIAHGLCPDCGYDLRATRGRCPECGAGPGTQLA